MNFLVIFFIIHAIVSIRRTKVAIPNPAPRRRNIPDASSGVNFLSSALAVRSDGPLEAYRRKQKIVDVQCKLPGKPKLSWKGYIIFEIYKIIMVLEIKDYEFGLLIKYMEVDWQPLNLIMVYA
jgi:hypothetical protein